MKASFSHKRQAGFTMVEIIVTIVVGAIMIGIVNLALVNQTHISQSNRDLVIANAYVEGKVEALRSAGFKALTNSTTNITSELPSELSSPRSASLTVSSVDSATKKIDIAVTYNDQGAARTYTYSTYVGELGVGQY